MALTNIQNEFLKMRLQNNPEFAAKYFPNVILQPPSGPLYDVIPDYKQSLMFGSPKTVYEEGTYDPGLLTLKQEDMPKGPLHSVDPKEGLRGEGVSQIMEGDLEKGFSVTEYSGAAPTHIDPPKPSYAEFRKINVPYDTPGSFIDIEPTERTDVYGSTRPGEMFQRTKHGQEIPVSGGQSATIRIMPEMIAGYGTPTTSPRNEMVPTPEYWPDQSVDYVNQADINSFIEDVLSHEVSHSVSAMPEYAGITGVATGIDFKKMFPAAGSEEAQKAITRLNLLHREGGGLGPVTEDFPWGEYLYESDYPATWTSNLYESEQEELYNRAKDLEKIKKIHPNDFWKQQAWKNNINFMNASLSRFPKQFPSKTYGLKPKIGTYLKKVDPQVKSYLEKVKDKIKKDKIVAKHAPSQYREPDRGGRSERTFSRTSPGGISQATSRAARSGMSGWRLAQGGLIDKALPGRSRDI